MKFTQNWFETTAKENFTKYLEEYKGKDGLKFLEVGCFEGMATRWLLENILTGKSDITVIDTFEGSFEHVRDGVEILGREGFEENIVEFAKKVYINQGFSQDVLKKMEKDTFDFIYIDGDHRSAGALQDLILSWPLLKSGGIMIMDDYAWSRYGDNLNAGMAYDAFLGCFEGQYELLLKEYQIVLRKI